MTPICLGSIISKTAGDTDSVTMEHLQDMEAGPEMGKCSTALRDPKRSRSCPKDTWMQISRKALEIELRFQRTTNRK